MIYLRVVQHRCDKEEEMIQLFKEQYSYQENAMYKYTLSVGKETFKKQMLILKEKKLLEKMILNKKSEVKKVKL